MNNVESSKGVNSNINNVSYAKTQTTDIKKESPDKLKEKIESGEVSQSDFVSTEEFDKFVAFLSQILGEDIKIPSKSEIAAKVEVITDKKENLALKTTGSEQNTRNVIAEPKIVDSEIVKEGINNPAAKQVIQNPSLPVNANAPVQDIEVALFKADTVDKSAMIKEQAIQMNDKTVVLHTSGGNNLSITGNEVTAQGEVGFLEETRTFAPDEGFHESGKQEQPEDDDSSDLEKIYFTKDSDQ